jgi:hypothetical protein
MFRALECYSPKATLPMPVTGDPGTDFPVVIAGLDPAIHLLREKGWMPGSSPA